MRRGDSNVGHLVKSDLQKFFKRLRINRSRLNRENTVSYYANGEYGDSTDRPHYHAILFGVDLLEHQVIKDSWGLGHVHCGVAEADSIRYVAQYIDKKLLGVKSYFTDRENPFQLSSQGLGVDWLKGNIERVLYDAALTFRGAKYPISRYYRQWLERLWPEAADGVNDRLVKQSAVTDAELILELAPEFGGRTYNQLSFSEKALLSARIYARNKVISDAKESEIKFKLQRREL